MDTTLLMVVLERLGWTSLQTALLVGVVALLCRTLPSLPAATRCWLWWLVSLQAVLGLVWSQPLQLPWLPAAQAVALAGGAHAADAVPAALTVAEAGPVAVPVAWWVLALGALWLSGVLVTAWRTVAEWRRCRALLAAARPCDDDALVQALQLAAEAHGLRRPPRLWTSDRVDAPQIIGPLRPVLLLPTGEHALQGDALDLALTHELQHLQRRDLQWGLLPALAQHLFFFHPLLRLAVREYAQAREEAVDAAVIAGQADRRQDYGRLLLQLGVAPQLQLGVASAAPSLGSLKRRLRSLQSGRACPKALAVTLTLAVLAVGVLPLRLVAAPSPSLAPVEVSVAPATVVAAASPAVSAPSHGAGVLAAVVAQPATTHAAADTPDDAVESAPLEAPVDASVDVPAATPLPMPMALPLPVRLGGDVLSSQDAAELANLAARSASDAARAEVPRAMAMARAEQARRQDQARWARDAEFAAARAERQRASAEAAAERASAKAERELVLAEAARERDQAFAEAAREREQAFAEAERDRKRALAEAARERDRAQSEARRERDRAQAEAARERARADAARDRAQAEADARAERAEREAEERERARERSHRG
ncbi:M56 family metallopeptidase [Stenotrophomonas sp. 24(2023)]|uniref:M56 family metallopeptidase n=1 Tax=Stenotrophomonas sp. 24(2023) TaxID=3068324 RepID=UPI0027DF48A9|nr:M56 family metallopeptidase [Stenotrophomonas sp. 24(2023)]WMJ71168.1 M56 family metallopeptidase [Stenotrophomonas sp. 24(2023)]